MESQKKLWLGLGGLLLVEGMVAVGFWVAPRLTGKHGGGDDMSLTLPMLTIPREDEAAFAVSVNYSTAEPTNQDVDVTIEADCEIQLADGWTRDGSGVATKMTKTFSENTTEAIEVMGADGGAVEAYVTIGNIDKTPPTIRNVWYSTRELTSGYVTVSFEASEEIVVPAGWEYRNNAQRYVRTFTSNWSGIVAVRDLSGNTAQAMVSVSNIDRTAGSSVPDSSQGGEVEPLTDSTTE